MAAPNPILAQAAASSAQLPVPSTSRKTPSKQAPATSAPQVEILAPSEESDTRLAAVEDALASSALRLNQVTSKLEAGQVATSNATAVLTSSIADVTSANQISTMAKQNAQLQLQNNTNRLYEAAGGIDEQVRLMTELREDGNEVANLLDEREAKLKEEPTGIFIIDQIVNAFGLVGNKRDLNEARKQELQTRQQIANVSGSQEAFARVNTLNKKTLNDAVIEANYKGIAAEGAIKGAEVELANIQSNAAAMSRLVNADQQQNSNLLQSYRLEGEAQNRAVAAERLKFQREDMTRQREQWEQDKPRKAAQLESLQLQLKDLKDPQRIAAVEAQRSKVVRDIEVGLELEKQQVTSVQRAQSLAGATVETAETIGFKISNPVSRERYIKLQELGGADKLVLGSTPFEAISNLSIIDPANSSTSTVGTRTLEAIKQAQIKGYKTSETVPPKDLASIEADFDAAADVQLKVAATDIKEGDASNPYQAPPMAIIERSAAVQNTALWQKVLSERNLVETSPQRILDASIAGVLSKTITPEQAAEGIDAIFTAAALYNNTNEGGFSRVGLGKYNQVSYNAAVTRHATGIEALNESFPLRALSGINPALSFFGKGDGTDILEGNSAPTLKPRTEVVDLMDRTKVQNLIVKLLSSAPPIAPAKPAVKIAADAVKTDATKTTGDK